MHLWPKRKYENTNVEMRADKTSEGQLRNPAGLREPGWTGLLKYATVADRALLFLSAACAISSGVANPLLAVCIDPRRLQH
jgi:hypothetical protein